MLQLYSVFLIKCLLPKLLQNCYDYILDSLVSVFVSDTNEVLYFFVSRIEWHSETQSQTYHRSMLNKSDWNQYFLNTDNILR